MSEYSVAQLEDMSRTLRSGAALLSQVDDAADMLAAYAERIKVDESAVPAEVVAAALHEFNRWNGAEDERSVAMDAALHLVWPQSNARDKARLSERKTVHVWLNDLHIEREEFGRPLCLLRRLRILCDRYFDTCEQLSFEIRKHAAHQPAQAVQQEEYGGPDFEERCETLAKIERDMRIYLDEGMLLTPYTLELLCNRIKNVRDAGHDNVVMSLYNFRTLRRLAARPRAVPDGWKAVTSALVSAAELMISEIDTCGHEVDPAYRLHLYEAKDAAKALLAAAPSPGESA